MNLSRFALLGFLFVSAQAYCLPFSIVPASTLPTSIISGGSASASYTVTNNTASSTTSNYVKWLPPNVTQNTSGAGACGTTFDLGAKGSGTESCTLYLTITGAVNSNDPNPHNHLFVCFSDKVTCAGTNSPLNITSRSASGLATAVGDYNAGTFDQPLSYYTLDGGNTWTLSPTLPVGQGNNDNILFGAACDSSSLKCRTVGVSKFSSGTWNSSAYYSQNGGQSWTFASMPTAIGDQDQLNGVACSGSGQNCVAVGSTNTGGSNFPISLYSTDGGQTWLNAATNPPSVNVNSNSLSAISCDTNNAQICAAVGNYDDGVNFVPLSSYSTDGGQHWTTPVSASQPAPQGSGNSSLSGVSCTSNGLNCTAVGNYIDTITSNRAPLSYYSTDGGQTWSVSTISPEISSNQYFLNSVACGSTSQLCTAAGNTGSGFLKIPFSYYSLDGGKTWTPSPTPPPSQGTSDDQTITGVSCDSSGTSCLAVGEIGGTPISYYSTDGGQNWTTSSTPPPSPAGAVSTIPRGVAGSGP